MVIRKYVDILFYIFEKRRYYTLQGFKKYDSTTKSAKLCHIRSKSNTGENGRSSFALCMGLDIIELLDCIEIHILVCITSL